MKAFVKGPLPPAPKPTLPPKIPEYVYDKASEFHERIKGRNARMYKSNLRGGEAIQQRFGKIVKRVSDDEREQIIEMLKSGLLQVEICEKTGRDRKTIRKIKKAAGL